MLSAEESPVGSGAPLAVSRRRTRADAIHAQYRTAIAQSRFCKLDDLTCSSEPLLARRRLSWLTNWSRLILDSISAAVFAASILKHDKLFKLFRTCLFDTKYRATKCSDQSESGAHKKCLSRASIWFSATISEAFASRRCSAQRSKPVRPTADGNPIQVKVR